MGRARAPLRMSDATNPACRNLYLQRPARAFRRQQRTVVLPPEARTRQRMPQVPGINGYLVGPIVGSDRTANGKLKPRQAAVQPQFVDALTIKRGHSVAHRFGPERYSWHRQARIPLVAIELAAGRGQAVAARAASAPPLAGPDRPGTGTSSASSVFIPPLALPARGAPQQ